MKLLLDTHIWIWSAQNSDRLVPTVRRALGNASNELWLSPISIWEALMLEARGRLELNGSIANLVEESFTRAGMREASLNRAVALETAHLETPHRDLADRFLAATAQVYELTLVTSDTNLLASTGIDLMANPSTR